MLLEMKTIDNQLRAHKDYKNFCHAQSETDLSCGDDSYVSAVYILEILLGGPLEQISSFVIQGYRFTLPNHEEWNTVKSLFDKNYHSG